MLDVGRRQFITLLGGDKRSISAVVRYSRVRTEEFTVVGTGRPPVRFSTIFCPRSKITSELSIFLSSVNRWPTLARSEPTRTASAGGQLYGPYPAAGPRGPGLKGAFMAALVHNRPGRLEPFIRNGKSVREPIVRRPAHPKEVQKDSERKN
jgi:hypothetical protein